MLEKTVRLFIRALIIGVLINLGLNYATPALPLENDTVLRKQALEPTPLAIEFQPTDPAKP